MENVISKFGRFETVFVLFFLSVDLGQNLSAFSFETAFLALTVGVVAFAPFVFEEEASFFTWATGRLAIVLFAGLIGVGFGQAVGKIVPAAFAGIPLALAGIAAVFSCAVMYLNLVFVRYAE